ncbi:hypothetical protein [Acetobacter nitrogenifigens]|nr:hypothetical protein [Acetobacter nitrogenifigens]
MTQIVLSPVASRAFDRHLPAAAGAAPQGALRDQGPRLFASARRRTVLQV